jgi:hypothetical protein
MESNNRDDTSIDEIMKKDETSQGQKDGKYVVLMETNEEESEQWYYFIRVEGNEENINFLHNQLDQVDWELIDGLSTFELEMDYFVSAQTAKEMSKLALNYGSDHRKFDGKLQRIDFDFRKKDGNETKMCKVFDMLGNGKIDEYISEEDMDSDHDQRDDSSDYEYSSTEDSSTDGESVSSSSSCFF